MPAQCLQLKEFVVKCFKKTGDSPRQVFYIDRKENNKVITKFKVKTRSGLYTLVMNDKEKIRKLKEHLKTNCILEKAESRKN